MSASFIYIVAAAALLTGSLLGALVSHVRGARRIESLRVQLTEAQMRLESITAREAERLGQLEHSEARLRAAFDSVAAETLRSNSEMFLRMARESLGRDQLVASGALKERGSGDRAAG